MMHQHLTTDELKSLFEGEDRSLPNDVSIDPGTSVGGSSAANTGTPYGELQVEQRAVLRALHERFARNLSVSWSALVRAQLEVRLLDVETTSPGAFQEKCERPGCEIALRSPHIDGFAVVSLPVTLLHLMIDRMLGGQLTDLVISPRPLTEIEHRLVSRVRGVLIDELQQVWGPGWDGALSVERVPEHPSTADHLFSGAPLLSIGFELEMGVFRGTLDLCLPCHLIQAILEQAYGTAADQRSGGAASCSQAVPLPAGELVELVVTLAEATIGAEDLDRLAVGDVIATDQDTQAELAVSVLGTKKFSGVPGARQGRKALQVKTVSGTPTSDGSSPQSRVRT
ncbi:MAG: hypothetical protein CMJ59_05320 [Planctomycetaceae bacterium]|nr:hypothetical protein [Planctomycetaceae bacterium]